MRVQRRELNVFSMSALDLFASGMGAFVLLAIIALPFFPNTGMSTSDSSEEEQEEQVETPVEVKEEEEESEAQIEFKIPPLDIVICLDVTGSMASQVDGMKTEITSLAEVLDRISPSVGIGIVAFGDRRWQRPIHPMDIIETTDMPRIRAFVNRMTPGMRDPLSSMNSDAPEAVAAALQEAVEMSWRSESEKRYIIVITDNPAYPDKVRDAFRTARGFSSQEEQHVSAVLANASPYAMGAARPFLTRLAEEGKGNFVDAAGGESVLSSILLAVLDK